MEESLSETLQQKRLSKVLAIEVVEVASVEAEVDNAEDIPMAVLELVDSNSKSL